MRRKETLGGTLFISRGVNGTIGGAPDTTGGEQDTKGGSWTVDTKGGAEK